MTTTFKMVPSFTHGIPELLDRNIYSDFAADKIGAILSEMQNNVSALVGLYLEANGFINSQSSFEKMTVISGGPIERRVADYYIKNEKRGATFICRICTKIENGKLSISHTSEI